MARRWTAMVNLELCILGCNLKWSPSGPHIFASFGSFSGVQCPVSSVRCPLQLQISFNKPFDASLPMPIVNCTEPAPRKTKPKRTEGMKPGRGSNYIYLVLRPFRSDWNSRPNDANGDEHNEDKDAPGVNMYSPTVGVTIGPDEGFVIRHLIDLATVCFRWLRR